MTTSSSRRALWLCCCIALLSGRVGGAELRGTSVGQEDQQPESSVSEKETSPKVRNFKTATSRRDRFPSVEERVKIYMSNWYLPPCSQDAESLTFPYEFSQETTKNKKTKLEVTQDVVRVSQNYTFHKTIEPDMAFWLDEDVLLDCARPPSEVANLTLPTDDYVKFRINMRMYCADVLELLDIMQYLRLEQGEITENDVNTVPMLFQFGDMKHSHVFGMLNLPHLKKFRSGTTQLDEVTSSSSTDHCLAGPSRPPLATVHGSEILQPIVWKLATHRHYRFLPEVYQRDTPWKKKKDMAIWRGQLTGALQSYNKTLSDMENCNNMKRCKLVWNADKSKLIDAKLTTTRNRLANTIEGVDMVVSRTPIENLMAYKGLIMLEGNDVASGLKWALLSQSVVLMPPTKHTSWAMEELLEPWVHYIPLNEDASDVEEKMQWVIDHDAEAQRIAERATLWMEDLAFHPDAARDDFLIKTDIVRRYRAHFRADTTSTA